MFGGGRRYADVRRTREEAMRLARVRPAVFVGSSSDGLRIAQVVQVLLGSGVRSRDLEPASVWPNAGHSRVTRLGARAIRLRRSGSDG
jgi:hypothetical protein